MLTNPRSSRRKRLTRPASGTNAHHRHRLSFQKLEDRRLLAGVTVNTTSDVVDFGGFQLISDLPGPDNVISLREALIATNNTSGADEIGFQQRGVFGTPQTIELTSGQLTISDDLTLNGPGATQLTIDAQFNSRLLNVDDGNTSSLITVNVNGVTLYGGLTTGAGEGGAGIRNFEQLNVASSVITENRTTGTNADGTGILNLGGNLTIDRSTLFRNFAYGNLSDGGGIHNEEGDLSINDSTIHSNLLWGDDVVGGGIFSDTDLSTTQTTITNSTISSNGVGIGYAAGSGGGIYNSNGRMSINNCTITMNVKGTSGAAVGGGVASSGDNDTLTTVLSSIISGNFGGDIDSVGGSINSFTSAGHNLVGFGNAASYFDNNDLRYIADPGLSNLGYYGGITPTHMVLAGSAAIDRGANLLGLATDQRGAPFVRVDGSYSDVGATERQTATAAPFPLVVDTVVDDRDGDFGDGSLSLREAIELANGSVGTEAISFDTEGVFNLPQTIQLQLRDLRVSDSLVLDGPGASVLTVDASGSSRVMNIRRHAADPIDVTLQGLTVSGGRTSEFGGGISNREFLTIVSSVISQNSANMGGGVYNSGGQLLIIDSLISDNETIRGAVGAPYSGGGIANAGGDLTIINSTIEGNRTYAGGFGGGAGISHVGGDLTVSGSTISGNSTILNGGGIYSSTDLSGLQTTITNTTISGNTASAGGGTFNAKGLLQLHSSTVTDNEAAAYRGGGVLSSSATDTLTEVFSTIIAGNALDDVHFDGSNSFVSGGHNLIGIGNATSSFLPVLGDQIGNTDPGLGRLSHNGGRTWTHPVLAGSPSIDMGALLPGLTTDQRGLPFVREAGVGVDVGAVERQSLGFPFIVDVAVDESDANYDPGDLSLREAIGLANGSAGPDVIGFAFETPQRITLTMGELAISGSVILEGPGAGNLVVDGNHASRVFDVNDHIQSSNLDVTFDGMTVTGGVAAQTYGAGISSWENLTVTHSSISGNSSDAVGGGIFHYRGSLLINESTLANNYAYYGGAGIFSDTSISGPQTAYITNSTFSGNVTPFEGGGIYNNDGRMLIRSSTITGNSASYGAGVASVGGSNTQTDIFSTIIAGNLGTDVDFVSGLFDSFVSSGHNLIGSGNTTRFSPATDDQIGVANPGLGPLTHNGGPTWTHAVLASSPARDHGALLPGLTTDQRGAPFARLDGPHVDVGAVERQTVLDLPTPLIVDTAIDDLDGYYGPGDLSLREAIGLANGSLGFDVILFDMLGAFSIPQTIVLESGQLPIHDSVMIESPNPDHVVVEAQQRSRHIDIWRGDADPINVALFGMTLTGGNTDGKGGAIQTLENLELVHSRLTGNTTALGGGGIFAYAEPYVIGPSVSVRQTTIADNSSAQYGGGIASVGPVTLELIESTIDGNDAYVYGGGISANRTETIITSSTISDNSAGTDGGGIANNKNLVVNNSTISGNTSFQRGGGIYTATPYSGSVTVVQHSTITANEAPGGFGSGICSIGDPSTVTEIASSIIAGNVNSDVDHTGGTFNSFISAGYNVIGTGDALSAFINNDQRMVTSPELGPLTKNGGPAHTHALLPSSPALDMGNPTFLPPPEFDQRGAPFARVYNGRIDAGAFEFINGDFNGGGYDCADVNALVAEIVAGTNNPTYDLNSDLLVNHDDLATWLSVAGVANLPSRNPYLFGDATLDGVVDGQDFVAWNTNKFQSIAKWCSGDFNADGVVDGQDFVVWNMNKFTSVLAAPLMPTVPSDRITPFDHDLIEQATEDLTFVEPLPDVVTSTSLRIAARVDAVFADVGARRFWSDAQREEDDRKDRTITIDWTTPDLLAQGRTVVSTVQNRLSGV